MQQEYLHATGPGASSLMHVQNFTGMNNCSEVKRAVDTIIYGFKCSQPKEILRKEEFKFENNYIANCSKNLCNHSTFHTTTLKYFASNIVNQFVQIN